MNQKLPKPTLEALAREATPAAHPSSDVLTAFVEHTLSGGEKQQVTDHLARCADCREVVFVTSSAAEEPVAEEQDLLVAAAVPRISPALLAKAHAARAVATPSPADVPRRRWAPRWVWAMPVGAALLFVAGFLVHQRFFAVPSASQLASKMASNNAPAMPVTVPHPAATNQLSPESAVRKPSLALERETKTTRAKSDRAKSYDAMGTVPEPSTVAQEHSAVPAASGNNAVHEPATIAIGGPATTATPAAPHPNSFAASEAGLVAAQVPAPKELYRIPQVSIGGVNVTHPQWRITAEGHLEHFAGNAWTRELANQTTAFRVVSVIGDEVWVGGSGGALFHSSDKGQQWGRVFVVASSGTVTAPIVSIQFDDPQNGVVITEGGSRYGTYDGGITWTSQ